jgi:acyl-CoA thioesterase I
LTDKNSDRAYSYNKKKKVLAVLGAILVLALCSAGLYYYLGIYQRPFFDDPESNYIASSTPSLISPGDEIDYEIHYMNSGARQASELTISFTIPENTTLEYSSLEADVKDTSITYNIGSLKKGQKGTLSFKLAAKSPLDDGTVLKGPDLTFSYYRGKRQELKKIVNQDLHMIRSSPKIVASDLRLTPSSEGELRLGDKLEIAFEIENRGDMQAREMAVNCSVPQNTRLIEEGVFPKTYRIQGTELVWSVPELAVGQSMAFKYSLELREALTDRQELLIDARITLKEGIALALSASREIRLYPDFSTSSVFIEDVNGEYLWPGDRILLSVQLSNTGERDSSGAKLICPIPSGTAYEAQSATPGAIWSEESKGLVWDVGLLKKGESKKFSFTATASSQGTMVKTDFLVEEDGVPYPLKAASLELKKNFSQTIVAMGDSLIALSDWVQRLERLLDYPHTDHLVIASALSGETAAGGLRRFESVAQSRPDIIIIAYGTNDASDSLTRYRYYLDALVKKAKETGALVFLQGFGPMETGERPDKEGYEEYIQACRQTAAENDVPYIDVYGRLSQDPPRYLMDWAHYSPEGSAAVSQIVYQSLLPFLDGYGLRK